MNVIARQVYAYSTSAAEVDHDALMKASEKACRIHDLITTGPYLASMAVKVLEMANSHMPALTPSEWGQTEEPVRQLLSAFMMVRRFAGSYDNSPAQRDLLDNFDRSIVDLREWLAAIQDLKLPHDEQEKNRAVIAAVDFDEFAAHCGHR